MPFSVLFASSCCMGARSHAVLHRQSGETRISYPDFPAVLGSSACNRFPSQALAFRACFAVCDAQVSG
jgi:hypothetical protein